MSRFALAARLIAALLAAAPALEAQGAARAQSGVSISHDTVTVGDPFFVRVRVRAAPGSTIEFPDIAADDTAGMIEALDPRQIRRAPATDAVEQEAIYRLAAWEPGRIPLGLGDVVVRRGAAVQRISLADQAVFVRSVLPADSTLHVPRPARDIFGQAGGWWRIWALLAALALLALAVYWWWRTRRRARAVGASAFERAELEFRRVEALRLLEAGEPGRYVALMAEIVRDYLAAVYPVAPTSLTSSELLLVARALSHVPADRLGAVLSEVDLVKFARQPITGQRAGELAREARAIVRDIDQAERSAAEAAAAAKGSDATPPPVREAA